MGKIYMKAVQQQVFNLNKSGEKSMAYVLRPTRYSTIDEKQIVEYCAQNSMVPKVYISGAMVALAQCFTNFLLNGHHCVFPGLGTFSLTSTGFAEGDVDKAGLDQLKKLNVRFLPCTDLKTLVENTDVELDGVYDIAGETIIEEASEGKSAKTQKYYKRVNRSLVADDYEEEPEDDDNPGGGSGSGGDSGNQSRQFTITVLSADSNMGMVTGGGTFSEGSTIQISASPKIGNQFEKWSDGVTTPNRNITVTQNLTLTASFVADENPGGGGGGDNPGDYD